MKRYIVAINDDPGEKLRSVASHLGLHYFQEHGHWGR